MARWFVDRLPQQGIPSVSLRRLLPGARFEGCPDWEVSGCTADSRRLDPGQIFVAIRGERHDGHDFVAQALERGAAGVVVERPCPEAGRLQVVVPDSRVALAKLCHALAGEPADQLATIGVTGTCGRVATSLFLRSIFEATGVRFGLVGSLGWSDGETTRPSGARVAGPEALVAMLAEMVEHGCKGSVIEVSSATLRRRGIEGLAFDTAVVTDLGGNDTDDLLARRRLKARLFRGIAPGGTSIVNADDPHAALLGAVHLDTRLVTFALEAAADVSARIERIGPRGSRFLLRGFDREVAVDLRLIGPSHISHALAAAAVAWSRGLEVDDVVAGLEAVTSIPGRLEAVGEGQDFEVRIDQAQTAPELREALTAIRSIASGRIHCVVGAEGCLERTTRLRLAESAETGADRLTLTTDNPRTEDPNQILDDLLAGCRRPGRVRIEIDRRQAIEAALADARPGDAVLIAGKGQRAFQIHADRAEPFDDREVAAQWLRAHRRLPRRSIA